MPNEIPKRWRGLAPAASPFIVIIIFCVAPTASARILTLRPPPSSTWNPLLPFTIGMGVEYETDREQTQVDFPMFVEYNISRTLKVNIEPNVTHIAAKVKDVRTVTGFADLETSFEYEFLRERRYRPAFTVLGGIKWPTSTDPDIGNPGRDYIVGLIASKDFGYVDADLAVTYTASGDPTTQDPLEITLAGDWHLNHFFDIEGEVVRTIGASRKLGASGVDLTEGTLGGAWHITKRLKVELGGTLRSDRTWQIVTACEFSFTGD